MTNHWLRPEVSLKISKTCLVTILDAFFNGAAPNISKSHKHTHTCSPSMCLLLFLLDFFTNKITLFAH